jgi:hypothetical protein
MYYLKRIYKLIFSLSILVILSLLFAQQYSDGCSNVLSVHLFDFFGVVYTQGLLEFMKNFNWAFLVLLLFVLPRCTDTIRVIIELLGEHLVKYGAAINPHNKIEPTIQTEQEKKEFNKEKNLEIREAVEAEDDGEIRRKEYKARIRKRGELYRFAVDNINKQNIENFTLNSKIDVTSDPVVSFEKLLFDFSYRYMGRGRARRYINSLVVTGTAFSRMEKFYKYIRIMNDINNSRRNQYFAVEIIFLNINENSRKNNFYDDIKSIFQKAINNGILAIKEYGIDQKEQFKLVRQEGWILEINDDE